MFRKLLFCILCVLVTPPATANPLSEADKHTVITNAAKLLEERYVYPDQGRELASKLRRTVNSWRQQTDPEAFAKALTDWLRANGSDGHLGVSYSAVPIAEADGDATFDRNEMDKWYGPQINHGVERIERLPGNIMLLDLRVFAPTEMAGDVISAAMNLVAQGDALIIDLRRNGGGGGANNLITGYLLDTPETPLSGVYKRPDDKLVASSSPAWVPGRRFGGTKPLFILTSKRTFSAAEAFTYDLQALKRAIVIGETSGGGAHPFEYRRLHPHFALNLPEARSVSPITGTNWQDVGVKPDVAVPTEQALEKAIELAREAIAKQRETAESN